MVGAAERVLGWGEAACRVCTEVKQDGDAAGSAAGAGEGGSPGCHVGHGTGTSGRPRDAPATEIVLGSTFKMGQAKGGDLIFKDAKDDSAFLKKLKQFAMARLSSLRFPGWSSVTWLTEV